MQVLSKFSPPAAAAALPRVRAVATASLHTDDGYLSVAPMMDYTDRFMRFMLRKLSRHTTLYTEMVVASTLVHCSESELERFLSKEGIDGPNVFQVGGSDPELLRKAAAIIAPWGYDAINLNCGCPSDRVAGAGCFGAALMRDPDLVADCCAAIAEGAPGVPVSVKCRIGVTDDKARAAELDEEPVYAELARFVRRVSERGGVSQFIVHARRAVLGGLSPDANRKIPPLRPQLVHRLAADFPTLRFSVNGGLETLDDLHAHLPASGSQLAGVMVGRAVMARPWHWATADTALYGAADNPAASRRQVLREYAAFAEAQEAAVPQRIRRVLLSPLLNLFAGEPHGKQFRAAVDRRFHEEGHSFSSLLLGAAEETLLPQTLDAPPGLLWHPYSKSYYRGPYAVGGPEPVPYVPPRQPKVVVAAATGDEEGQQAAAESAAA